MFSKKYSNIIAFDDAPFDRNRFERVKIVGTIYANLRLDGMIIGEVDKDGSDATVEISRLVTQSKFFDHIRLILLQGVTVAGFNVIDVNELHDVTGVPVLIMTRKQPDLTNIRTALLDRIADGAVKWAHIERLGAMEPVDEIFMQRVGIEKEEAAAVLRRLAIHSKIPEPLRIAHMIAAAVSHGISHGHA